LYVDSNDFDNSNESLTMWTWLETTDNVASIKRVFSKYSTNKNYQSFTANLYEDDWGFTVWTDNLGNSNSTGNLGVNNVVDGKPHFCAVVYNNNENSIMAFYDGIVVYYKIDDALNERNNGESKLSFGCQIDSDLSASQFLNANLSGMGYARYAMTPNELRKIYAAGAQRQAYIDGQGTVQIPSKKKVRVYLDDITSTVAYASSETVHTLYAPESLEYKMTFWGYIKVVLSGTLTGVNSLTRFTSDDPVSVFSNASSVRFPGQSQETDGSDCYGAFHNQYKSYIPAKNNIKFDIYGKARPSGASTVEVNSSALLESLD
jgi:hypothetical protein